MEKANVIANYFSDAPLTTLYETSKVQNEVTSTINAMNSTNSNQSDVSLISFNERKSGPWWN